MFGDKQHVKLQETPDQIPEGEAPQTVHLCAYEDLVDAVKPGDVQGNARPAGVRAHRRD